MTYIVAMGSISVPLDGKNVRSIQTGSTTVIAADHADLDGARGLGKELMSISLAQESQGRVGW